MTEKDIGNTLNTLEAQMQKLTHAMNEVINATNILKQTTAKVDPTVEHQLILQRAVGGFVITLGRDGSRVVCTNITEALLVLANYCEETVVVNGKSNKDEEEDD